VTVLIDARNLCKSFDGQVLVDDLTLQVSPGEIYGLVGPDGAGKTTTMRLLCGALQLTSGEVRIAGHLMSRDPEGGRALIGYLPQHFSLYEELTVMENLRFFAEARSLSKEAWRPRSMEILQFVGLAEFTDRRAGKLSGGMRQKLGLAVALVHQPRILLLDEPTTGVDPVTRQDFWQLIIRLALEEQTTVLITTPYMDEASRCTRLGFMREGRLLVEGSPPELKAPLADRILLLQGTPLPLLRDLAREDRSVEDALLFGDRIHLRLKEGKPRKVISRLARQIRKAGGEVFQLRSIAPLMEDVFIAFVEPELNKDRPDSQGLPDSGTSISEGIR
jgi:ABC-2 type transport system ATP-binding protein